MADGRENCGVRWLLIRLLDSVRPLHKMSRHMKVAKIPLMVQKEVGRVAVDEPLPTGQVQKKAALARPGGLCPASHLNCPTWLCPTGRLLGSGGRPTLWTQNMFNEVVTLARVKIRIGVARWDGTFDISMTN